MKKFSFKNMYNIPLEIIINTNAIRYNIHALHKQTRNTEITAVLKANAYGIGAISVAHILIEEGVMTFFVAYLCEALLLRKHFKHVTIGVFSGPLPNELDIYREYNILPILATENQIKEYKKWGAKIPVAIQLETGFSRLGLDESNLNLNFNFPIMFLLSHLSCAKTPNHPNNNKQNLRFQSMCNVFNKDIPKSFVATAGIFLPTDFHYQIVRPGIGLYGYGLAPKYRSLLKPAITIRACILQIKWLNPGDSVGYNATVIIKEKTKIGIISMGYADGFTRSLQNNSCWFQDKKLPLIGVISMDFIAINVTHAPELKENDWVTIINEHVTPDHLTDSLTRKSKKNSFTTPHEMLTYLSHRAQRHFI